MSELVSDAKFTVLEANKQIYVNGTEKLTLQTSKSGSDAITLSATSGNVSISGNNIKLYGNTTIENGTFGLGDNLTVTGVLTVKGGISSLEDINLSSVSDLEIADGLALKLGTGNDTTFSHDGTNTNIIHKTGNLNFDNQNTTGATIIQLGTDTTATDFQVKNNSETVLFQVDGSGTTTIPSGQTMSVEGSLNAQSATITGNLVVSGALSIHDDVNILTIADIELDDGLALKFGTSNDTTFTHNGTDTVVSHGTGNFLIDNTNTSGSTIIQLGTDTATTDFQVQNNTGDRIFSVSGNRDLYISGALNITGTLLLNGQTVTGGSSSSLKDNESFTFGDGNDLSIVHTGSASSITNTTGNLSIHNQDVGFIDLIGGNDTSTAGVRVKTNSGSWYVKMVGGGADGQGLIYYTTNTTSFYGDNNNFYITSDGGGHGYLAIDSSTNNKDLLLWNFDTSGNIINRLGTKTNTSTFNIQNSDRTQIFQVDGSGAVSVTGDVYITGDLTITGNLGITGTLFVTGDIKLGDGNNLELGSDQDLVLVHNGSQGSITNKTGDLIIDNESTTSDIILRLGSDTTNTKFSLKSNTGSGDLFKVEYPGLVTVADQFRVYDDNIRLNKDGSNYNFKLGNMTTTYNGSTITCVSQNSMTFQNTTSNFIFQLMGDSRHFRIQNSGSLYPFRAFTDGRVLIHTLQCEQNVGISGTLDVTGGISITGNLTLEDNNNLQLGSGQDLTLVHNGSASTITNSTGNLTIDNTSTSGSTIIQLGTDTATTDFQVQSNSGDRIFSVSGNRDLYISGALNITGTLLLNGAAVTGGSSSSLNDNESFTFGDGNDLSIVHTGSAGSITNSTGNLTIENTTFAGYSIIKTGDMGYFEVHRSNDSASMRIDNGANIYFYGMVSVEGSIFFNNSAYLNDNKRLYFGTSSEFQISHTSGGLTQMLGTTGDILIDNQDTNNSIIIRLGTDTDATSFKVQNNSESNMLTVDGSGVINIPGATNITGNLNVSGVTTIENNLTVNGSLSASSLGSVLDANNQAITNINVESGTIDSVNINNCPIGSGGTSTGSFTTLTSSSTTSTGSLTSDSIISETTLNVSGEVNISGAISVTGNLTLYEDVTLTVPNLSVSKLTSALNANNQAITNINVESGTIDSVNINNCAIGSGGTSTGAFTTLTSSSTTSTGSLTSDSIISETTLNVSGEVNISGAISVTGNLTLYEDVTLTVPNLSASKLTSALNANNQAITNINVESGTIDSVNINNCPIGSGGTSTGAFTTLTSSSTTSTGSLTSDSIISETTLNVSGEVNISGAISVTGNLTLYEDVTLQCQIYQHLN